MRKSKFQKARMKTCNIIVRVLPKINNLRLQPGRFERVAIPRDGFIQIALTPKSNLMYLDENNQGPSGVA